MASIGEEPQTDPVLDLLTESKGLPDFLLGLMLRAASLLGGQTPLPCSISGQRGKIPAGLASSSERARRLDRMQHEVGEGPWLVALGGNSQVFVPRASLGRSLDRICRHGGPRGNPVDAGRPD